jgi:hypothetical protein
MVKQSGIWSNVAAIRFVLLRLPAQGVSDDRRDLGAEQLDRAHDLGMWHRSNTQLQKESLVPEDGVLK